MEILRNFKSKPFINVIESSSFDTPALPGKPISLTEFRNWINNAEQTPMVSLGQAKGKWAIERKYLQNVE